ncbi:MAG: hydrogenase maturation nickel metallochaperone HypA [Pseudomonadota bacterium]
MRYLNSLPLLPHALRAIETVANGHESSYKIDAHSHETEWASTWQSFLFSDIPAQPITLFCPTLKGKAVHEMGIAMQIIEIATNAIPKQDNKVRVERVNLKVGKLSAVVPASLGFCFDIAIQNTPLSGARLIIEEIPVTARCKVCENEWTIEEAVFYCPTCDNGDIQILSGQELNIESIEIAD